MSRSASDIVFSRRTISSQSHDLLTDIVSLASLAVGGNLTRGRKSRFWRGS